MGGQVFRFALVGAACTVLYLGLFIAFRIVLGAQAANLVALLLSALTSTALNKRFTFGLVGRAVASEHVKGLIAFGVGAGLTAGSLVLLDSHAHHPGVLLEVVVLLTASAVATVIRYVMFRWWIFTPTPNGH